MRLVYLLPPPKASGMEERIKMNWTCAIAGGVAVWLVGAASAGSSLIENGSFEVSAGLNPGGGWTPVGGGSAAITGWTTLGGGVDYMGTLWPASDGVHCLDLNNTTFGGVWQSFATVPGSTYTVTFDVSANMFGGPAEKVVEVSAGGESAEFIFDYVAEGATQFDPKWASHEWTFVASGPETTLAFESLSGGVFGPALDNVVVTGLVPGPGAAALLGLGAVVGGRRRRR